MQPSRLNFHSAGKWISPLERTLIKAARKHQAIAYNCKVWTVEGKAVNLQEKKPLSALTFLFVAIIHELKKLFSCPYRRHFKNAIALLDKIQNDALIKFKTDLGETAVKAKEVALEAARQQQVEMEEKVVAEKAKMASIGFYYTELKQEKLALFHKHKHFEQLKTGYVSAREDYEKRGLAKYNAFDTETKNLKEVMLRALEALQKVPDLSSVAFDQLSLETLKEQVRSHTVQCKQLAEEIHALEEKFAVDRKHFASDLESFEEASSASTSQIVEKEKELEKAEQRLEETKIKAEIVARGGAPAPITAEDLVELERKIEILRSRNQEAAKFFDHIRKHLKVHDGEGCIAKLWEALFTNWPTDTINSCKIYRDGTFELNLKKPLRIWFFSTNEKNEPYPEGGVVFNFDNKISFAIDKNQLNIKSGISTFVKTPDWAFKYLRKEFAVPTFSYIQFKGRNDIVFGNKPPKIIGIQIPMQRTKKFFDQVLGNWGCRGLDYPLDDSNESIIRSHLPEALINNI